MGRREIGSTTRAKPGLDPLWWLAIGGVALIAVSMAVAWQSVPNPMAVQWSTDGAVTSTMSKVGWAALFSGAWAFASGSLVFLRAPFDWRRGLMIVILGVLVVAFVSTLMNNLGAQTWREAKSLHLLPVAVWVVIATGGVWALDRVLIRLSDRKTSAG